MYNRICHLYYCWIKMDVKCIDMGGGSSILLLHPLLFNLHSYSFVYMIVMLSSYISWMFNSWETLNTHLWCCICLEGDAEKFSIWPAFVLGNLSYHDSALPIRLHKNTQHMSFKFRIPTWALGWQITKADENNSMAMFHLRNS